MEYLNVDSCHNKAAFEVVLDFNIYSTEFLNSLPCVLVPCLTADITWKFYVRVWNFPSRQNVYVVERYVE